MVCEQGADIIFVPSCTDDRQGFWRVRYCCHARAIENQVFVAVTGTVGNLAVEGLGLHFGQAAIITPSDFPFCTRRYRGGRHGQLGVSCNCGC